MLKGIYARFFTGKTREITLGRFGHKIILKCVLKRDWVLWTGLLWLRIGTSVNTVMNLRVP
jgi:hypothetical protein